MNERAIVCGAGSAGLLHALAYRAHGVSVVGVHDPDRGRAEALASLCGAARVFASAKDLFGCDAAFASVCSPPRVHVAQALAAARDGRYVLVEKPVATTAADLTRLGGLTRCVPVVQWRAGRALRAVRRAIAAGALGPAPAVSVDLAWARDDAYFAAGRATRAVWGCGALLSVGIHAVDAVVWAMGRRVTAVSGLVGGARRGMDVETSAIAQLAFEGGGMAALRVSFDGGADATRITVCGGGVTAEIAGGEADPTAGRVRWSASSRAACASLVALEEDTPGALGSPLVVPFIGEVVRRARNGASPGAEDGPPSVGSVANAHAAVLTIYGSPAEVDGTAVGA